MKNPTPLLALALVACHFHLGKDGDDSSLVLTGLEPLEDENLASAPQGSSSEPYPEEIEIVTGDADDYAWAHARAYVHQDVATTWAAFANPDVVVDRRRVDEWTVADDVADYDVSFLIANTSHDIIDVEFDLTWIEGATAGSADDPEEVGIRWSKTGGSDLVKVLDGSAQLLPADDGVTEVQLIEHLDTPGSGSEDIQAYFEDLYASVLASVAGEDLPTWD